MHVRTSHTLTPIDTHYNQKKNSRTAFALQIRSNADLFCTLPIIRITLFMYFGVLQSATITSGAMGISPNYMKFEYPNLFFSTPLPETMRDMKEAIAINILTSILFNFYLILKKFSFLQLKRIDSFCNLH